MNLDKFKEISLELAALHSQGIEALKVKDFNTFMQILKKTEELGIERTKAMEE